jgi:hypothetical protein
MTSDRGDDRLRQPLLPHELPDLVSGLIPIHEGHVAVHQDQTVVTATIIVLLYVFSHTLQGLQPIFGFVTNSGGVKTYAVL